MMNSAQKLIKNLITDHQKVKVDHLAFSFKISNLRRCEHAGFAKTKMKVKTDTKINRLTGEEYSLYKHVARSNVFPHKPKIDPIEGKTLDEIQRSKDEQRAKLNEYYEQCLKVFADFALGFSISPMRGRGLHGYRDSMILRSNDGQECGYIGLGGQQDTVFFQISGTGCKYLFNHVSAFILHHWLYTVLGVSFLSRVDLCVDDFDDNFNCDYARKAYVDGFFRTSNRGQSPVFGENHKYTLDANLNKQHTQEMVTVGSRTSAIYWRIYNKKLEQGIDDDLFTWHRTEAELKKWPTKVLLDLKASFAGLCPFAQSIEPTKGKVTRAMTPAKDACLELAGRVRWFKRMAGKALVDVLEHFEGDINKTFGLLTQKDFDGGKVGLPSTYKHLINHVLEC